MRRSMVATLGLLLVGCAAATIPTAPIAIRNEARIPAAYDQVWGAVLAALADAAVPIRALEKASGSISTEEVAFGAPPTVVRSLDTLAIRPRTSMGFLTAWTEGRYRLSVLVSGDSSAATVRVVPLIEAYDAITERWWPAQSRGVLEARLLGSVEARLR